jgi:hypothetical protein
MKPALLNSIYEDAKPLNNFNELAKQYAKKIHVLYLNLLDKAGVKNLDEKIKVTTKFPDGYVMTDTFKAGHHLIEYLFDSDTTQNQIQKLDNEFLKNCSSSKKEELLEKIKHVISEEGSENLNLNNWLDVVEDIKE